MTTEQLAHCCAVGEIGYLENTYGTEDALKRVAVDYFDPYETDDKGAQQARWAHLVFTEVSNDAGVRKTYGKNLADYVKKHKLGSVVVSKAKINPNHRSPAHWVKVYTWSVNQSAFYKWAKERDAIEERDNHYSPSWW